MKKFPGLLFLLAFLAMRGDAENLSLHKGDHICIIGNTLGERMQNDGWLETLIQAQFPNDELVFRNLAFSGDELTLRLRSANFGSPDEHLAKHKADVIFAFFGFNESFAGPGGLEKFKKDLTQFIHDTRQHKYNGKSAPQIVLFSPIAQEDLHNPNLPDGSANNKHIQIYTAAIQDVAGREQVACVDLYHPSLDLYAKSSRPLTINGIHLNAYGDKLLAPVIVHALFPDQSPAKQEAARLEKIRAAVLDKDFYWFNRYRTVDGYNVYGGRSQLKYVDDISNWDVMQREMEVLDVMTANRDKRVWAVAQGGDLKVDDSNTPPFIEVESNKPGPGPEGTYSYLDPEAAIEHMKVPQGLKVNLFASEKDFPALAEPVQMAFDTKGRLWVAVMPAYPHWRPKDEMTDKVLILEDTDQDGRADKCVVFANHLNVPTGLEFYRDGLLLAQAPYIEFLKDTDGDDHADFRERVLGGIDSADTHHTANSFVLDPGGALYFQEGTFHHTQVETLEGPVRNVNAGVYRYEPRSERFGVYVAYNFANPHGHVFDRWGQDFVTDGTGADTYDAALFSGKTYFPKKHNRPPRVYKQRTRPCPGTAILSSEQFPDEMQQNLMVANVIGFLGILQYKVSDNGSGFSATEVEPIVQSDDPNFRPTDMEIGPDGAIYFLDWQNPIIGHMQHHLRDPSRDHSHGRVYRIVDTRRPLMKPAKIAGASIPHLLDLLKSPTDSVRYRAKIELGNRNTDDVMAALKEWTGKLDPKDPDYEHNMMEALWLHQYHNVVDRSLLERMLRSPDSHARAAATRVLCYWRDRVPDALDLLKKQVNDDQPRVRLEAVRACSFFQSAQAADVALEALNHPMDDFLKFTLDETMNTLDHFLRQASL